MPRKTKQTQVYVVIAGDSGVYSGYVSGPDALGPDGRVVLMQARHLRRYYVAGRKGDGSALDLARLGLDPSSQSVTAPSQETSVLLGVRRLFVVEPAAVASFLR